MISFAYNLKQIFHSGEGDALTRDGIINFPQLTKLSLSSCSFFGPKSLTAQLPSLQVLTIQGYKESDNSLAQLQGLTRLEKLYLYFVYEPNMSCIWKVLPLSNLTILVVRNCKRLRYIFTDIMIANLVQLKVLKISTCKDLEQIIAKNNDDEKNQILSGSDLQSLCFPKLCRLEIRRCNKLKSLFLVAMTSGLPKLQILKVSESSQLLRVK
ncbi:hypothetical protein NC651_004337 [Populus alba x Populus x berolinensis]|nr:hypothetical protein NC651_004337 [Populus alba x Populus x berolinensis]